MLRLRRFDWRHRMYVFQGTGAFSQRSFYLSDRKRVRENLPDGLVTHVGEWGTSDAVAPFWRNIFPLHVMRSEKRQGEDGQDGILLVTAKRCLLLFSKTHAERQAISGLRSRRGCPWSERPVDDDAKVVTSGQFRFAPRDFPHFV